MRQSARIDYYQQSLTLCRELQGADPEPQLSLALEGRILGNLGFTYYQQGHLDKAITCYDQSLAASPRAGDHYGAGRALLLLGGICREQQRLEDAAACYEQSLGFFQESSHRHSEGLALVHLGSAIAAIRNEQVARRHWHDALAICVDLDVPQADEVRALLWSTTDSSANRAPFATWYRGWDTGSLHAQDLRWQHRQGRVRGSPLEPCSCRATRRPGTPGALAGHPQPPATGRCRRSAPPGRRTHQGGHGPRPPGPPAPATGRGGRPRAALARG
jgi:tetratricopeptide (TPR) repeat protein